MLLGEIKNAYQKEYIRVASVFLLFFSCFSLIYFSLNRFISMDDPFFHIRFAEIFRERGITAFTNFHWLYFSKISQNQSYFIYYNFLFYVILLPLTFVKPLFFGLKLYGVISASLSFSILYYFLYRIKINNPFFWVMGLFSVLNYGSVARFLVMRPFTLAPVLLLLLLYFSYKKKYLAIFALSVIYFFWHTATFFFPVAIVGIYSIFENFYGKKLDWKLIATPLIGITISFLATLLFAPGLFIYMKNIIFGVLYDTVVGKSINLAEGGEVYSANVFDFIRANTIIIALLIIACTFEFFYYIARKKKKIETENAEFISGRIMRTSLFFLSICFLLGTFFSKRNGDFFLIFSTVYIAVAGNIFINSVKIRLDLIKKSIKWGLVVTIVFIFIGNFIFLHDQISSGGAYDSIQGTAEWLKTNTKEGEVVFNPTWNWFTLLFYYNTHNNYIVGIEPRFLYDYNPQLYWTWWNISQKGYICSQPECSDIQNQQTYSLRNDERKKIWYNKEGNAVADAIANNFKSHYIVTSKEFARLNELMSNNDRFERVYTDNIYNSFFVYKIK